MKPDQISPYRRHLDTCKHKSKGKDFTLCNCPVWGYGYLSGRPWRRSLQTNDWTRASRRIEILLNGGEILPATSAGVPSIETAVTGYLADAKRRALGASTIYNYRKHLNPLVKHFDGRSVAALDVASLKAYVAGRRAFPRVPKGQDRGAGSPLSPRTARAELESMRAFCAWCVEAGWIEKNPAKKIKPPIVDDVATMPYTADEVRRLLNACGELRGQGAPDTPYVRQRARALVLTLLYSGLRVSDVAALRRSALEKSNHLTLRTEKTGVPVKVLMPASVAAELRALPAPGGNPNLFFWAGDGDAESGTKRLWEIVHRVGVKAGIHARPHRFRDTFAVELLSNGADIRTVQKLLSHDSVHTTEKHYAHFVAAHQALLDSAASKLNFGLQPGALLLVHAGKRRLRNA